ncbi:MAG: tetratricopeptide repeat protein [Myxococcota bacterium]
MQRSVTAEESYRRGRDHLERGETQSALDHFRTAHQVDRANPRYRSFYGLGLALVERRFDRALELCRSAAKEEFFNPELYHNLARVHLAFGFKAEAIRYLRRGLMIDPGNGAMQAELRGLGMRRRPVLSFLPRRHPVNRLLGRFIRVWGEAEDESTPEPQSA